MQDELDFYADCSTTFKKDEIKKLYEKEKEITDEICTCHDKYNKLIKETNKEYFIVWLVCSILIFVVTLAIAISASISTESWGWMFLVLLSFICEALLYTIIDKTNDAKIKECQNDREKEINILQKEYEKVINEINKIENKKASNE